MTILITGGDSRLARGLAAALAAESGVRLIARRFTGPVPGPPVEQVTGDLRVPEQVRAALAGVQVVIHAAPYPAGRVDGEPPGPDAAAAQDHVLDEAARGSYVLFDAARTAGVERFILLSTLDLFDRLPDAWRVDEGWRPRPTPEPAQLGPWLAELSVRENSRVGTLQSICLRLGRMVDDETSAGHPFDARWVHMDDVVQGVRCALRYRAGSRPDWSIFHLMAPGPRAKLRLAYAASAQDSFGYQPVHDFRGHWPEAVPQPAASPQPWQRLLLAAPLPARPIHRVAIFGAGGPLGSVATQELAAHYLLRLTDVRPLAELAAEAKPQAPGAPLPVVMAAPHEDRVVDVRDPAQVQAACAGMDALVNCTVVRSDLADAFLVNTLGVYHVLQAAVAHRIRRVVHTGPLTHHLSGYGDYQWDYDVPVDAPGRPYESVYIHSKYLGQEICRVFAENAGLEIPVLLFMALYNPALPAASHAFMVSWGDAGRAVRRALEVTRLPTPYEPVFISADLPHGHYALDKARRVLDWTPRDGLESFWQDR
jgi:nucleoside-diphosphate-sugar epimerase